MADQGGTRLGLTPLLAVLIVLLGALQLLGDGSSAEAAPCDPATESCGASGTPVTPDEGERLSSQALAAENVCFDVGYLCADLTTRDRIQLRRWREFAGPIVVHVPRPDFEDRDTASRLQEAAARGLRAWNGQPFEILADLRGDREAHFAVRWSTTLPGDRIGVARTQWSSADGLSVLAIELSTRSPFDPERVHDARQVQLTAAHEMGHALGLQHSDAERDVMYPSNTATRMSAQDYRTMEVLYQLPDGAEILR